MTWVRLPEPTREDTTTLDASFKSKARFLVDEDLGIGTTQLLRELKYNVKDVSEVGLTGHPDENLFAYAFRTKRIILTHDDDFLDDRKFPFTRNPGVVVLPGGSGGESVLLKALGEILSIIGRYGSLYAGSKIRVYEDGSVQETSRTASGQIVKSKYRFPKHGMPMIWEE